MFQCSDIVFIVEHRFIIASFFSTYLIGETLRLVFGIVQLREAITNFTATDEEFKAVSDKWIIVITAC